MRKFTNKQAAKIEQWLDEAFNDGYKAAELDAKFLFTAEEVSPLLQKFFAMGEEDFEARRPFHPLYDKWIISEQQLDEAFNDGYKAAELDAKFLFTAEANMKRAEAEFNKREPIGYGQSGYLDYGTPDELYTFWGARDDH